MTKALEVNRCIPQIFHICRNVGLEEFQRRRWYYCVGSNVDVGLGVCSLGSKVPTFGANNSYGPCSGREKLMIYLIVMRACYMGPRFNQVKEEFCLNVLRSSVIKKNDIGWVQPLAFSGSISNSALMSFDRIVYMNWNFNWNITDIPLCIR